MLDNFLRHIRQKNLLDSDKTYLVAISGGLDSVVLTYLMRLAKIKFILAHCNFGLRGEESDGDEAFVRQWAKKLGVDIVVSPFDTLTYAHKQGISTQMAARDLRYHWFDSLAGERNLAGIVVAHHLDDQVETVLLNLMRGTGIEGIYGMAEKREKIIRPLLNFSKKELHTYAVSVPLQWREDSSNAKDTYKRNYLRNRVLPLIEEQEESAVGLMKMSFDRVKDTGRAFFHFFKEWLDQHLETRDQYQMLSISKLKQVPGYRSVIYYWLKDYGFNYFQATDIAEAMQSDTAGKIFYGRSAELNLDREYLILGTGEELLSAKQLSASDEKFTVNGQTFHVAIASLFQLDTRQGNAMLDLDKLDFPLEIRNWAEGDKFKPLGMQNFKKVSDFLIDLKIPLIQKKTVKVLCSGGKICWLIGLRVDDRFKVAPDTKAVLHIKRNN